MIPQGQCPHWDLTSCWNNSYYQQEQITLALPRGWKIKEAVQGEIKSAFASSQATFTLPPVGSGVFRLVR